VADVDVVVVTLVFGFAELRITNFNSRERLTAKIAKTIKEIAMIQRRCRRLDRTILLSGYIWLLCIVYFTINFKKKQIIVRNYFVFVFDYQRNDKVQVTLC
jgi:hypothetical protein